MVSLEGLLGDPDAITTCNHLLSCYRDDKDGGAFIGAEAAEAASASFLLQAVGKPSEYVKATLDNLNHALLIINSLRYKAVLSNTSDIIKSMEEATNFVSRLNEVSTDLKQIRSTVESRYGKLITVYSELCHNIICLERIGNVQAYVIECVEALSSLGTLKMEETQLKATLDDFAMLLNIGHTMQALIVNTSKSEESDLNSIIAERCNEFRERVIKAVFDKGILHLFRQPRSPSGDDPSFLKMMIMCHYIFREVEAGPLLTLRLVDETVRDTELSIDLRSIVIADKHSTWQHIFLKQLSEFMYKYKSYLTSLYVFCRAVNYRLSDHLEESELQILKTCKALSKDFMAQHDPLEILAPCELYAKRCVGVLQNFLERMELDATADLHADLVMLAPQLVAIGEAIHDELRHLNIPFNLQEYYYKNVCEGYAKEFMVKAAELMMPLSKSLYSKCIKILNAHNVTSWQELSPEREIHLSSLLIPDLPSDSSIADIIHDFLEKSKCCDTIHRSVLQVANSALQNIMDATFKMTTVGGSRLMLNDGGSKISLKRPNDAQIMNSKIHQFITYVVDYIEPCLVSHLDKESQLFRSIKTCRELKIIDNWAEDVGITLWHAVSYISSGDCQEFRWKVNQVLTASQHLVKICNFLCDNYFNPLIPGKRVRLLRKLATHAISAFVIYAITVWPLEEPDKITLLNVVTELEMTLSEILKESLPKLEADYLSSLRRLMFLGDDSLEILMSPALHQEACIRLPDDVISLHLMTRIVNWPNISEKDRKGFGRAPLHQFLGASSTHSMLAWFRDAMLLYEPQSKSLPVFGSKCAEYLSQFQFLEEGVLNEDMKHAMAFLISH